MGFTVGDDATLDVGAVRLRVGQPGEGIVACALRGADLGQLDGLTTHPSTAPERTPAPPHPNGVSGVDHVVAATPDFGRTLAALRAAGLEPRRLREAGPGLRQAFYVLGPALLELAGPAEPDGTDPATFWGLTLVADDLDALASRLGPLLGPVTDAVQPGRRIATLRREAGVATAVAFMTPR